MIKLPTWSCHISYWRRSLVFLINLNKGDVSDRQLMVLKFKRVRAASESSSKRDSFDRMSGCWEFEIFEEIWIGRKEDFRGWVPYLRLEVGLVCFGCWCCDWIGFYISFSIYVDLTDKLWKVVVGCTWWVLWDFNISSAPFRQEPNLTIYYLSTCHTWISFSETVVEIMYFCID